MLEVRHQYATARRNGKSDDKSNGKINDNSKVNSL